MEEQQQFNQVQVEGEKLHPLLEYLFNPSRDRLGLGPVKWHKLCSRYHRTREPCDLIQVTRKAKSGKKVTRWAHPDKTPKQRKTKARRS